MGGFKYGIERRVKVDITNSIAGEINILGKGFLVVE